MDSLVNLRLMEPAPLLKMLTMQRQKPKVLMLQEQRS